MGAFPFTVFDHVACGVRSIDEIAALLETELGAAPHRGGPGPAFRGGQWEFAGSGRLELIEPRGEPGGFLHRFLEQSGPGIHHITFKVPDIYAARDRAEALGYRVVGFRDESAAWKECFLHPKEAGGIVVQMAESDPDAPDEDWLPIARVSSGSASQRTTLLGPRLLARDETRARRCFVELLGGVCEESEAAASTDRELSFRWPESPLTIRVLVEPEAAREGAVGLEFADFEGSFPPALSALLGAPLLRV